MSDILALRGYLHSARQPKPPAVAAVQKQTPAPAAVAPAAAAARSHPGGFAKGDPRLGKPPWTKDRFPIAFMGGKKGTKKTAPRKRELEAALSAAVAMANPHMGHDALAKDFLTKHVRRIDVTRIMNRMGLGELSVSEAAGHVARLSRGALLEPAGAAVSSTVASASTALAQAFSQGTPASTEIHAMNAPSTGAAPQPTVTDAADLLEPIHAAVGAGGVVSPDLPARRSSRKPKDIVSEEASARKALKGDIRKMKEDFNAKQGGGASSTSASAGQTSIFNSPLPLPEI